ncbi:MAG: S1 RNA-binding domain-containing protein, partial [Haemophilus parainfluenzae]|nr:S1 RNA-binding domain-containing protein [Haemophilus parainfluenzae]
YAPRIHTMKIDPKKIKDVIGKGGATIRALTEETGTSIDIDDDGTVKIAAVDSSAAKNVMARIEEIVAEVEAGAIYKGKVTRLADFGAFVAIVGNKEGLVHISQIAEERVEKVSDYLQVGQEVTVKVVEIDRQGRIRLTMKDLAPKQETEAESAPVEDISEEQE